MDLIIVFAIIGFAVYWIRPSFGFGSPADERICGSDYDPTYTAWRTSRDD
jgi:hypothetical protein